MKLSIFQEVQPLPKSKAEKHEESKKASQCSVKIADSDEELADLICTYAWSPFIFAENRRLASNFVSCDFLVYDIDEGLTIDECSAIIEKANLCCLCLPSPSHTDIAPRFRIVLPLARTITSAAVYQETWKKGAELFGVVDEQCKDLARFFFSCTKSDGFWTEGELFAPVFLEEKVKPLERSSQGVMINVDGTIEDFVTSLYGEKRDKIPEAVDYFIKNAHTGLPGNWVNSLNSAVFSLALSGVDEDAIFEAIEQLAPEKLDKRDIFQIKRSIKDGQNAS